MTSMPLVIFRKQLGDVLLLEPALAKLSMAAGSKVMLATRNRFHPLLMLMENVIPAPLSLVRKASRVVSFDPSFKAGVLALTTYSPDKRLIVTRPKHFRPWHGFVYRGGYDAINESELYRAEYFFNVMPCSTNSPFRPPRLLRPPRTALPDYLPSDFILLHPTSAWKRKSWPEEKWSQVLQQLHALGVGPFVITGGGAAREVEFANTLARTTNIPLINLCGKTPLPTYLAIVAYAKMVLCIDGSATHLAAAFGRPSITLFGPTHPLHWHFPDPISTILDARSFSSDEHKPPVDKIPVNAVMEAVLSHWNTISHNAN